MVEPDFVTLVSEPRPDYTLIDSGNGRKLEAYGARRFIRPEPQAMWEPATADWQADGEFIPGSDEDGGGRWYYDRPVPQDGWPLKWNDEVSFTASCTPFRHLGFFPDMDPVWRWMRGQLASPLPPAGGVGGGPETQPAPSNPPPAPPASGRGDMPCMNLFGYTGVGTLALSAAGAQMVHVDASKKSVAQARENAALSGMADRPIRWIVDDAAKFVAREVRRERRYDGILLDPPKYGRGPDGEVWRLEEDLPGLIANCRQLLDANSRFLFLTVYAVRMSAIALGNLLQAHFADLPGKVEFGELAVREEARGLLLPTAIFARWSQQD
ncbi:MAG: class I SAM-dependent methyltransferase [Sphingomonadales bacterium]|jgi:23S rRNA (cytosine1962-C5)-methyltransferase|nr:class I SAM-dependent methyltransferase [Sphingomonadales bacterium]MBK9004832.1 class I SAM-dependent methyltransferase [Sphingomonadales bacterium]MBK9267439.1 class I SAM-dependent methyltransferase [Sphingomonadales bacterium]MBP6433201.1 class I SAM-dependent methyltransferase [Sphingorhabdus sp.]